MRTQYCPTCNAALYEWREHTCPPRWECILDGYHDEEEPVAMYSDGLDERMVAESFAAYHFGDWDYPREMEIWVRKDATSAWKKFEVTVEQVPSFTAVEKPIRESDHV